MRRSAGRVHLVQRDGDSGDCEGVQREDGLCRGGGGELGVDQPGYTKHGQRGESAVLGLGGEDDQDEEDGPVEMTCLWEETGG